MAVNTSVDRDLLLEFFLNFSRFEYALKAGVFRKPGKTIKCKKFVPSEAKPDWVRFAVSLRTSFDKNRHPELTTACNYILDNPPFKEVVVSNSLAWDPPVRPQHESDVEFLLRMVRYIRNNLFHGGEHSNTSLQEHTDRTERLLRSALIILNECLHVCPQIKSRFDEAVI